MKNADKKIFLCSLNEIKKILQKYFDYMERKILLGSTNENKDNCKFSLIYANEIRKKLIEEIDVISIKIYDTNLH